MNAETWGLYGLLALMVVVDACLLFPENSVLCVIQCFIENHFTKALVLVRVRE